IELARADPASNRLDAGKEPLALLVRSIQDLLPCLQARNLTPELLQLVLTRCLLVFQTLKLRALAGQLFTQRIKRRCIDLSGDLIVVVLGRGERLFQIALARYVLPLLVVAALAALFNRGQRAFSLGELARETQHFA